MKDELGGKNYECVCCTQTKNIFLLNGSFNDKKAKGTKKCVIKRILKFYDYLNCLLNNETILPLQKIFKSEAHNIYTEEINKIKQ